MKLAQRWENGTVKPWKDKGVHVLTRVGGNLPIP